jgi:hypothetical protein
VTVRYLGQARSVIVNNLAHEPIVTPAEFDAAQGGRALLKSAENSLAAQTLLKGLIRCAGCGHTLKIAGSLDKSRVALPDLLLHRPLRQGSLQLARDDPGVRR